jgi:hypothetical protein
MEEINIWEIGKNVSVKPNEKILSEMNRKIHEKYGSKEKLFEELQIKTFSSKTLKDFLKPSYYKKDYYAPLDVLLFICKGVGIDRDSLQKNI